MATIITRETGATAKNSPLTNAELDANFVNLNTAKLEIADLVAGRNVDVITASGKTTVSSKGTVEFDSLTSTNIFTPNLNADNSVLTGINTAALHRSPNAVTAMFVYDTSKDSDGGAWTEKCQHTSWYNEALNGKWLGAWGSEFAARATGATLGPERITNAGFDNGLTGWTAITQFGAVVATGGTVSFGPNIANNWSYISSQAIATTVGQLCRFVIDAKSISRQAALKIGSTASGTQYFNVILAPGQNVFYFTPTTTTTYIDIMCGASAGDTLVIESVSLKDVIALTTASGDYYQSTVDGKFYRLWKNLLSYTDSFASSYWTKAPGVTVTDSVGFSTINVPNTIGSGANIVYKQSIANGTVALQLQVRGTAGTSILLNTDSGGQSVAFNGDWQTISFSVTGTSIHFYIRTVAANQTYSFDVRRAQLEYGSTATTYEAKTVDGSIAETFRGNKADFPRLAGIVAEGTSPAFLTIYDLTEAGRPMWMRFTGGDNNLCRIYPSSVAMLNGVMALGHNTTRRLTRIDFISESTFRFHPNASYAGDYKGNIAQRNNNLGQFEGSNKYGFILNETINAVAMTVLPDAPVDAVTGLQVPTIAVATAGGVSVIKHNGTVVNSARTDTTSGIYIDEKTLLVGFWFGILRYNNPGTLSSAFAEAVEYNQNNTRFSLAYGTTTKAGNQTKAIRSYGLVTLMREHFSTPARKATAFVTPTFNTGHLIGDIRRAYLADVDVGSVTAPLFDSNNAGIVWTRYNGGGAQSSTSVTLDTSTGTVKLTATEAAWSRVDTPITTVIGSRYKFTVKVLANSGGSSGARIMININPGNGGGTLLYLTEGGGVGTYSGYFTATQTTHYVYLGSGYGIGEVIEYDDAIVERVIPDRSYKAQAASITGTLTKTQVAAASQLVAYSGFSAANYLREPYSADLDFGTGEWSCGAWVNYLGTGPFNGLLYSEDLTQNAYNRTNVTITSNAITPPAGMLNADKVVESTSTSVHEVSAFTLSNGMANGPAIWAFRVKAGERRYLYIYDSYQGPNCYFDCVTGVVRNSSGGAFTATSLGDGWWQVTCQFTSTNTYSNIRVVFNRTDTFNASVVDSYTGDGTSGIYLTGFQINNGTVLLPYVKTTTAKYAPGSLFADRAFSSGPKVSFGVTGTGQITATAFDGTTTRTVTTTAAYNTGTMINPVVTYTTDGTLAIRVNGVEVAATRGTPLLSLNSRYNLLTYTEDFANAAWTKTGVTVTANAGIAPDGTITSDALLCSGNSNHQFIGALATSGSSVISIYVKPSVSPCFYIGSFSHGGTVYFDLVNKTVSSLVSPAINASIVDSDNGFVICKVTLGAVSNYLHLGFLDAVYTGSSTSPWAITTQATEGFIWGASAVPVALAALPYQRVGASLAETQIAPLTIGNSFAADAPFPGSISLLKLSATVPTSEQSVWMYEQEKQMFRDGAQVTLPDSGSIVDLAYDDATDKWLAVSATNESEWSGLVRTSVTPSPAGSYSKITASSGVQMQARTTTNPGVDITVPAYNMREELVRRSESAAKLSKTIVVYDYVGGFTATTVLNSTAITSVAGVSYPVSYVGARVSGTGIPADTFVSAVSGTTIYLSKPATAAGTAVQIAFTDFILPVGYTAKMVSINGSEKQESSTKDWTRLYDGFKETIRMGVAPSVTAWVQIQAVKEN